ncbi:hypothetical protein F5877DRAFT_80888 [Lentinula edodes]|nr:hypothetical protein F5877DRAFT_80888 [Lentinula edodes]
MNWPENVRVAPDDDLFEDAGHIASYGSMFDPSTNSLAAATMREKGGPQRSGCSHALQYQVINARFWPIRFIDPGIVDVDKSASPAKSFAALTRFETKLQNSGKSDDSQSTFISLALVKRNDVGLTNIIPDPFIWSDDGYDSADDDDDIQDSISRERKKATAASKANETTHIPAPTKSRTSADVLNRLL